MKMIVVTDDIIKSLKNSRASHIARHPHTPLEISVDILNLNSKRYGHTTQIECHSEEQGLVEVINLLNRYNRDIDIRKLITFLLDHEEIRIADLRAIMYKCESELFERLS